MNKSNKRAVASLILLFTFIMMPVSGIVVHVMHGKLTSHTWLHLHVLFSIIFLITGFYHVSYNWRALKHYLAGKK
jgi:F0F1-type ATP synthase assembly protein I